MKSQGSALTTVFRVTWPGTRLSQTSLKFAGDLRQSHIQDSYTRTCVSTSFCRLRSWGMYALKRPFSSLFVLAWFPSPIVSPNRSYEVLSSYSALLSTQRLLGSFSWVSHAVPLMCCSRPSQTQAL